MDRRRSVPPALRHTLGGTSDDPPFGKKHGNVPDKH
jgi:hypothetical protein